MRVKRALVSVSDKTGLEIFVKGLNDLGVEIISTGGTREAIKGYGVPVVDISDYTGYPEMLDGRVKTLHPKIHAGLLSLRDNSSHVSQMEDKNIPYIDLVVVNLYPFEKTVSKTDVTMEEAIENIDIGGPSMLRSAAKNYRSVAVLSSVTQYQDVLAELKEKDGSLSDGTLQKLAIEVFKLTSRYDSAILGYLSGSNDGSNETKELSGSMNILLEKVWDLRYGENPHQKGAFYKDNMSNAVGLAYAEKFQGKHLSFNNIMDMDSAVAMVYAIKRPAVSIVKHNNPCGVAEADDVKQAYNDALECDKLSAFGSIVAINKMVDADTAEFILDKSDFTECIVAPDFDRRSLEIFSAKKNLRIMKLPLDKAERSGEKDIKKVLGGMLVQDIDEGSITEQELKVVTKERPPEHVMDSLIFAWKVIKYIKSNAILLCQGTKTVGIGAGQMSRVDSVITAVRKAGDRAKGSVLASDAFFPMPDSIEVAHDAGISAVIQPGGSVRDSDVIAACDKLGIPMVFTGMRHFRH